MPRKETTVQKYEQFAKRPKVFGKSFGKMVENVQISDFFYLTECVGTRVGESGRDCRVVWKEGRGKLIIPN